MSRIGKAPIPVPSGVDVSLAGQHITVRGPKGTLERDIPGVITVRQDGDVLVVTGVGGMGEAIARRGWTLVYGGGAVGLGGGWCARPGAGELSA